MPQPTPPPVVAVISALGGLTAHAAPKYSYLSEFKNFILGDDRQQPELMGGLFGGLMKTSLAKKHANQPFSYSNGAHFTRLASCPSWIDCHSAYMNDGYSGICPQSSGVAA